jgi:hypothetical protein
VTRRHLLTGAAALACLLVGVGLLLLALDVARARASLRDDDARYRAAALVTRVATLGGGPATEVRPPTAERTLWKPSEVVPGGIARRLLAVDDDILFRRAVRGVLFSHPEAPGFSDPEYVVNRSEATAWLTDVVQGDDDAARRSRAANLLGILSFGDAVADYENRGKLLASAAGRFRQAVALDPANADAKYNLETVLASSRGLELAESGGGTNPSPGGKGSRGAGAGDPGSGY